MSGDQIETVTETMMAELDKDGSGYINLEEMMQFLSNGDTDSMKMEQVQTFVEALDTNEDGKISKEELKEIVKIIMAE